MFIRGFGTMTIAIVNKMEKVKKLDSLAVGVCILSRKLWINVFVDCIVISSIQINHCHCPAELVNRKILDE
jgi:hypothetical protein